MAPRTPEQFEKIRETKSQLILNTALRLFAERGFYATTVSAIAKEAEVSKGLMYNYFESKDEILLVLFEQFIALVSSLLNPNNDDEISNEEMESFFMHLTRTMSKDRDYWKLYFQLSMQTEVLELLRARISSGEMLVRHVHLIYKYFADRFPDPKQQMLFFSFIIKGFSLQYVLTPESVPEEEIEPFWERMKELFIVEKKYNTNNINPK